MNGGTLGVIIYVTVVMSGILFVAYVALIKDDTGQKASKKARKKEKKRLRKLALSNSQT